MYYESPELLNPRPLLSPSTSRKTLNFSVAQETFHNTATSAKAANYSHSYFITTPAYFILFIYLFPPPPPSNRSSSAAHHGSGGAVSLAEWNNDGNKCSR